MKTSGNQELLERSFHKNAICRLKTENMDCRDIKDFGETRTPLKILPNACIQTEIKLHFHNILDGPILVSGRGNSLKFPPGRSKSTFQRPDVQFCA